MNPSKVRCAVGLASGLLLSSGASAAELEVTPSLPSVVAPAGSSVLVEALITNSTSEAVFLIGASSDVSDAFAAANLFDEFQAATPDSLLPGESWEGPVIRLTIAPDAPVDSMHRVTVFFAGGDHPFDNQSLGSFTFALNDSMSVTGVPEETSAIGSSFLRASPNPARGSTQITFGLAVPGEVDVHVYDVRGREVRTLVHGLQGAGPQSVLWDGRDSGGNRVAAGIYFVKLHTKDGVRKTKVVRIE